MLWSFFVLAFVSMSGFGSTGSGISAVESLCQTLTFPDKIEACNELAAKAEYFEPSAVKVCAELGFPDIQMRCLTTIQNRTISETLAASCKGMTFHERVLKCLEKSSKAYVAPAAPAAPKPAVDMSSPAYLQSQVALAIAQLELRNYGEVRRILAGVLLQLSK